MALELQKNHNEIIGLEAKRQGVEEKISDLNEVEKNRKFFEDFTKDNREVPTQVREELDDLSPKYKKLIVESMTPEILIRPIGRKNRT